MQLTPIIAIHMAAALAAVAVGPVVLWARLGSTIRPHWHRAWGYGWTTLMIATAVSAIFIRDFRLPNVAGYTPIHLFVPLTAFYLYKGFMALAQRDFAAHQRSMQRLYISACLVAGILTLLPNRYLGNLIWGDALGLLYIRVESKAKGTHHASFSTHSLGASRIGLLFSPSHLGASRHARSDVAKHAYHPGLSHRASLHQTATRAV